MKNANHGTNLHDDAKHQKPPEPAAQITPAVAVAGPPTLQSALGDPEGLKVSGSARLRYEVLEGQPRAGLPADDEHLALRTTLFVERDTGVVRFGGELFVGGDCLLALVFEAGGETAACVVYDLNTAAPLGRNRPHAPRA